MIATTVNACPKDLDIILRRKNSAGVDATNERNQLDHEDSLQEEADDVDDHADHGEVVQQVHAIEHLSSPSKDELVDELDVYA